MTNDQLDEALARIASQERAAAARSMQVARPTGTQRTPACPPLSRLVTWATAEEQGGIDPQHVVTCPYCQAVVTRVAALDAVDPEPVVPLELVGPNGVWARPEPEWLPTQLRAAFEAVLLSAGLRPRVWMLADQPTAAEPAVGERRMAVVLTPAPGGWRPTLWVYPAPRAAEAIAVTVTFADGTTRTFSIPSIDSEVPREVISDPVEVIPESAIKDPAAGWSGAVETTSPRRGLERPR